MSNKNIQQNAARTKVKILVRTTHAS